MEITVTFADSDVILALNVEGSMTVDSFRAHALEVAGYPVTDALVFYQDQRLLGSQKLLESGVADNDIIMIVRSQAGELEAPPSVEGLGSSASAETGTRQPSYVSTPSSSDNSERNRAIEQARQQILYNPDLFRTISERMPELAQALHNPEEFRQIYNLSYHDTFHDMPDPNTEEGRKRIAQQAIDENLAMAMEEMPESFAQVTMLFTQVEVNGQPVKAFIDSGAQSTIMSPECAERTQLSSLIDKRYRGTAVGVGSANIIGRIHMAPIKIGGSFFPCAFTVIEGMGMDMLLGLDTLRHHQASIDLRRNALIMGDGQEVPFLAEADIPKSGPFSGKSGQSAREFGGPQPITPRSPEVRLGGSTRDAAAPGTTAVGERGASAGASTNSPSNNNFSEQSISALTALGFDRASVMRALRQTGGNAELAASLLFG